VHIQTEYCICDLENRFITQCFTETRVTGFFYLNMNQVETSAANNIVWRIFYRKALNISAFCIRFLAAFSPYHIGHFVIVNLHLQELVCSCLYSAVILKWS
jgi:hypothetical protein